MSTPRLPEIEMETMTGSGTIQLYLLPVMDSTRIKTSNQFTTFVQ